MFLDRCTAVRICRGVFCCPEKGGWFIWGCLCCVTGQWACALQVASAISIQTPADTKQTRRGRDVNKWFPHKCCDREPSIRRSFGVLADCEKTAASLVGRGSRSRLNKRKWHQWWIFKRPQSRKLSPQICSESLLPWIRISCPPRRSATIATSVCGHYFLMIQNEMMARAWRPQLCTLSRIMGKRCCLSAPICLAGLKTWGGFWQQQEWLDGKPGEDFWRVKIL